MPAENLSILITGSEVLDGRVLDTNSNFVAEQMTGLGLKLKQVCVCDDNLDEMTGAMEFLSKESSFILTSGGLGPTSDDITREAVAQFCKVELAERTEAKEHLLSYFERRGRKFDESNLKQALLPSGSIMIPNPVGTAPGFIAHNHEGVAVLSLSGVPSEFRRMFQETVVPFLINEFGVTKKLLRRVLRSLVFQSPRWDPSLSR